MRRFFLTIAAFLIALPALAVDCATTTCTCIGVAYKDPALSAPNDITRRIFSWDKAERRFNNQLIDHHVVIMLISYEGNGQHLCCQLIDNNNASAPWEAIALSYLPAQNGELDRLIVGFYDNAPAAGDRFHFVTGDATTAPSVDANNPTSSGLEITALMGGSVPRDLATGQAVITRVRNNHKPTLQSDMIANGC